MHKVVKGGERLVDRRLLVVAMQLVQVDVVGLEASQRCIHGGHDVLARVAAVERRGAGRCEALGRDDEPVALAPQPAAEDLLSQPPGTQLPAQRVGVRAIEEVDAALGGAVENGDCGWLVALQSEGHRAQAQSRYLEAGTAESGVFHTGTLPGPGAVRDGRQHSGAGGVLCSSAGQAVAVG